MREKENEGASASRILQYGFGDAIPDKYRHRSSRKICSMATMLSSKTVCNHQLLEKPDLNE